MLKEQIANLEQEIETAPPGEPIQVTYERLKAYAALKQAEALFQIIQYIEKGQQRR